MQAGSRDRVDRRLAAILAADVVGYSRLMEADEAGTAYMLHEHRAAADPLLVEHGGRIVKTTGDGVLIEFPSVVGAVQCAVAFQKLMAERNARVSGDRRMEWRVGIHLGDILIDGEDILGDGVNLAARLEGIAEPGGICISEDAFRQVRGKIAAEFRDGGEQALKNIARPVRVYQVLADGAAVATAAPSAVLGRVSRSAIATSIAALVVLAAAAATVWRLYQVQPETAPTTIMTAAPAAPPALPDRPSIAVLPFANLSGDPAQEFFADGLTENLIDALAQNPKLFIIARGATLVYRGKAVSPQAVAKEVGVRYVLEGSVQKSGDHIRVTAQLIDAITDSHLLSQKYDRDLTELFALEDDLTLQIAGALDAQFSGTERARLAARGTRNLEAWENVVKAFQIYLRLNPAGMSDAQKLAQRAVDLDPNYTVAWNLLGYAYFLQGNFGWVKDRLAALDRARQLVDKVLQLDPEFARAYHLRARLEMIWEFPEYDPEAALADARKAVELGPNDDEGHYVLGFVLLELRHFDEAAAEFATSVRLNPHPPIWRPGFYAIALSAAGHYEQAIAAIEAAIAADPKNPEGPRFRGSVDAWGGRYADAARSFERACERDPDSAYYAFNLVAIYDQLGRVDDAVSLIEKGPPQWRSVPQIRLWLALSYALADRKEQATAEFAAFRALAPKFTVAIERRVYLGYLAPQFFERIVALSREYGVPDK
jgi:adenylate cyclase